MNSIDILEKKEKIKDKLFPITHINGYINLYEQKEARIYTSELSRWQSATKDSLNLIETLIAENKELKEENFNLKQQKIIDKCSMPSQDNFYDYYNYIPKSKVEEEIDGKFKEAKGLYERGVQPQAQYTMKLLRDLEQSLLGKE